MCVLPHNVTVDVSSEVNLTKPRAGLITMRALPIPFPPLRVSLGDTRSSTQG